MKTLLHYQKEKWRERKERKEELRLSGEELIIVSKNILMILFPFYANFYISENKQKKKKSDQKDSKL